MYKHDFDFGFFNLYRDNEDGTAMFYEVDLLEDINPVKIENRLILYKWCSMRRV